ncbi:hypothetical protein K7X08_019191 [Anisodus acutangulus]|uniref:Proteasome assembly chaperone 3 n=1 Tax=Anisodus acutangulus TaxID=402998 RepID=A0A9Q1RLS5_9SOLA|nr:hypothetical protein K7X08_019191 [Anisodus acutangulus]
MGRDSWQGEISRLWILDSVRRIMARLDFFSDLRIHNPPFLLKAKFLQGGRGEEAMDIPVQQKKLSLDIKGNKTDIVICAYDDHFLVIATQIGSMGTILHARKEEGVSIHPTFSVSVLLGKRDEPMLVACARQIIEHISNAGSSRSLVLSLGLRDHSLPTSKGIVSAVTENCLW